MIYIGKYYSDMIFSEELFETAILLYKPLYAHHNVEIFSFSDKVVDGNLLNIDFANFVASILMQHDYKDESCLCYDYRTALNIIKKYPKLQSKFIGSNTKYIDWLNNKTTTRLWLSPDIQTPTIGVLAGYECTYNRLERMYPRKSAFILQSEISSGGKGTYLLTNNNKNEIYDKLDAANCYLVSPFIENANTYNAHICVSNKQYWISPISKQITNLSEYHPLYIGSVFNNICSNIITESLNFIAEKLLNIGFRGICGIDFILLNDFFVYIECNNRLQGSSAALDYLLKANGFPSLYQLVVSAYRGEPLPLSKKIYNKQIYCAYSTNPNMFQTYNNTIRFDEVPMCRYWDFGSDTLCIKSRD